MKFASWITIASLLASALFAQQSPTAPQTTEGEIPRVMTTVDIKVINVDVVVRDKRTGEPVKGLTRDDFAIYENGRPQNITNFYEVITDDTTEKTEIRTDAPDQQDAGIPQRPEQLNRKIIFFVDNLWLAPFNRNRVFKAMKEFAKEVLRPGDQAMIATWNRSMKVRLPFTGDPKQIEQTLDAIAGESALGMHAISERKSAETQIDDARSYQDAVLAARSYAQSVEHDLRQSVSALNSLMSTLGGVEGKKILVLTSEGFPMQPGRELFYYIDDVARQKRNWSGSSSVFIEGMAFNSNRLIESIAHAANANGISLYTLHAGGLVGSSEGSAENNRPISPAVQQAALSNSTDSLRLMADLTGGLATVGTNNFEGAFGKIENDLGSYYSLGYRAGTERVDRQRSLEVKVKNPKWEVRSRRSFVEKSVQTEMTDKVIANLFYESTSNDLKVNIRTGRPERQDTGLYRVPLEVLIPMDALTLLPRGETLAGGFTVYIVVSNKLGDMSEVQRQSHPVTVPLSEADSLKGQSFTYTVDLIMEPGRGRISVGVLDELTNATGFRITEVIARDLN